ncbi:BMP family ABC transporter substrate-binding protein [Jiella sp. MQZ9-1]|uniref:BMP family ABC transporter substrate-binding protein n=1 Tax=Jiella flava TaxID=2816857 RepID=A0A939FUY2_9HYPH|nr:BMP family ABC transporter substrate-binding protein [Jiella flava]MBO0661314.1 BMP family ABC transporter substrate-binding protein [Jiella flava]MCD2469959.1 BMP family ABC transporter substrate-binding protein [Jiella flava]
MFDTTRRKLLAAGAVGAAGLAIGTTPFAAMAEDAKKDGPVKAAFLYVGPVGDFGWTYAHDQARKCMEKKLGDMVKTTYVENVAEGPDAERVLRQLAQDGNDIIFATSFGFMNPTIKVAKQFPKVKFEHATGYTTGGNKNMGLYNSRFYEGRAVLGTIAGMMSKTGKAGYVASFPIPEVVMGIDAFQLAAQKVNPKFQTQVVWVNSWYDPAKEADAAKALLDQGADVITQHTDSPAPLQAAEKAGAIAFGQAWNMESFAPNAHMTAIVDNWCPYYTRRVQAVHDGTWEADNVWLGMKDGEVEMAPFNNKMPEDVQKAAQKIIDGTKDGSYDVFTGPIKDQSGKEKVSAGQKIPDEELLKLDWYVDGVKS